MQRVSALISTNWLSKVLTPGTQGIRILDSSWFMPTDDRSPRKEFMEKHIPGAQFFDIEEISDQTSPYSHTLPHPRLFGDYVGHLGISNDTHVIVYDNSEFPAFTSPRAWWMFRVFGHNKVSVLEGGLPKWISEGNPVTPEVAQVENQKYDVNFQPELMKKFEDMLSNLNSKKFQVMDARSAERFGGLVPEKNKDLRVGHIPNSKNIPFTSMYNSETQTFKSPEELNKVFSEGGIDLSRPLTATCGSGITACIISLGAFQCGKEQVGMFDGSWEEYAQRANADQIVGPTPTAG